MIIKMFPSHCPAINVLLIDFIGASDQFTPSLNLGYRGENYILQILNVYNFSQATTAVTY